MVNKERMELWISALESERYIQCIGNLRDYDRSGDVMHCAEGVGMEVAQAHGVKIHPDAWRGSVVPSQVRQWYGLPSCAFVERDEDEGPLTVVALNDGLRLSFWDIAQLLRAAYLKEEQ